MLTLHLFCRPGTFHPWINHTFIANKKGYNPVNTFSKYCYRFVTFFHIFFCYIIMGITYRQFPVMRYSKIPSHLVLYK